jgi:hypothetical protein
MTHDEMIAVIQAHKEGKKIQFKFCDTWVDCEENKPSWCFKTCSYRVKPSPKVIPWTTDDWREFKDIKFIIVSVIYEIHSWDHKGIYFQVGLDELYFYNYSELLKKKDTNGNSCGKVVEE